MKLETIEQALEVLEEYKVEVEKRGWRWDWKTGVEAFLEAGGEIGWLMDEQIETLIEMYLFQRPHAALAFHEPYLRQPTIWVEAKILLDQVFN